MVTSIVLYKSHHVPEKIMPARVKINLSYGNASGSDITPCFKIDIPLVVYKFLECYEIRPILSPTYVKYLTFSRQKCDFKVI